MRPLLLGLALALGGALSGCAGAGEGQLSGTLFLRDCPPLDPTPAGSLEVPNPLPSFSLDPQYFYGELQYSVLMGFQTADPRGVDRLRVRLQRNAGRPDRADIFDLIVYDLERYMSRQEAALARGEPGMPIVPPDIDGASVPLPGDPAATVRGALSLNITCWFPRVQPMLRGHVRFTSLGRKLGEEVAGEVSVTVEDARAMREQGGATVIPDTAGQLTGSFRFPLRAGPLVP
jgi:hypothetical protein